MKNKLFKILVIAITIVSFPKANFGQAPNLGTAADYVLFTSVGAITSTPWCFITGNVGSNSGAGTGFGNVNGQMHSGDGATATCAADLSIAYNQLNATVPTFFPAPLLGNGQTLNAGVYSIAGPATLNLVLTLDGQGDPNAVFIFQIQAAFSTNANSKVKLINGALACNVFWKVEGLVDMAAATSMKGTIIANNAAINMNVNDTLEGRALSTSGAIDVNGVLAYTPVGCGSPHLVGPAAPNLASVECYTLFSSNGPVTNAGATHVLGDVGTNLGFTTGYNPLFVTGAIHPIPDGSTAAAAVDLLSAYTYLNTLPYDIELLYPAQFGHNLVLTPHTYLMNSAVSFTDSLYLDAMGDPNAVFIIKTYGAFSTSTFSKVILINGALPKNVYWLVSGAVSIMDYSIFNGTIVCNNGAMDLTTGVIINGRALTTTGALSTSAITANMPPGCGGTSSPLIITQPINQSVCVGDSVSFWVTATGTNLTYQWRKGNVNLVNGGNISGATNDTLTINPSTLSDVAANYNVVVSGLFPPNETSINVSLSLNPAPIASVIIADGPITFCTGDSVILYGNNLGTWSTTALTDSITVHTSGNYFVTTTNSCGTVTSNHIIVNVNPAPIASVILSNGPITFCTGDSVTLSGNVGGTWNTTALTNSITVHTSGNYFVTTTNSCGTVTSNHIIVNVNPAPIASVILANGPITFCTGDSVILSGNVGGTWNTTALTNSITVHTSGNYFVTVSYTHLTLPTKRIV